MSDEETVQSRDRNCASLKSVVAGRGLSAGVTVGCTAVLICAAVQRRSGFRLVISASR